MHLICKRATDGPGLRNLKPDESRQNIWHSGYWDLSQEDAQTLVGGMIFLHEVKAKPSRFGGRVLSFKTEDYDPAARKTRVVFTIDAVPEGKGAKWRGADHAMASYGGIIDVP